MLTPGAVESIAANRNLFADAVRRGDAQTAASVYSADARLLPPSTSPMVGRDEIQAYWQAGIDAGVAEIALSASDVDQNEGLAYETGSYFIRLAGSDGARVVERGHYVQVYQRQADGSWQRAVEIFSPGGGQ
jgi:ketosteroid isomerase-like protein